jgi:hypothetical protein
MVFNPKVDISVRTALSLLPSAGDSIAALIGTAQYGPINEVVTCSSFNEVLNVFQEDKSTNTSITKGAEMFFANGGSILKIVRVADDAVANSKYEAAGAGSTENAITFTAIYKGTYGNNLFIDIDEKGTGRIVSIKTGNTVEVFDNNGATDGYTTNATLVAAINANSRLVTATLNNAALVVVLSGWTAFSDGNDGATTIISSTHTTAFDNLLLNEDWSLLMIPNTGQTSSLEDTDAFHTTILGKIENRANTFNKNGIFVSGITKDETIATAQARTTRGERFVLTAPSIYHTSRVDGSVEYLDGTYLGCALAGRLSNLDATGAAATRKSVIVEDLLVLASSGKKYYNTTEIEQMLSSGICVASNINGGLKWARGITRISDKTSIYFEINILRIIDELKEIIQETLDDYLGDPNSPITRDRMQAVVNGILNQTQSSGKITAYLPTVVTQGTSPDTVNVSISVQPTFATNFINVVITVS